MHAGTVAVLSAGTADEGVAEECRLIADFMGCYTFRLPDVSVDGLHRVLHNLPGLSFMLRLICPCLSSLLSRIKLLCVGHAASVFGRIQVLPATQQCRWCLCLAQLYPVT